MLVAAIRDSSGSYAQGFSVLIGLAALGAGAVALLPRRRRRRSVHVIIRVVPRAAHRKLGPDALGSLTDDELLNLQFRELDLQIEGTELALRIEQIYSELAARNLVVPPALLAVGRVVHAGRHPGRRHPVLPGAPAAGEARARRRCWKSKAATPTSCMRILRHEAGHAIDNAFDLRRRKRRRELFGSSRKPYPESYTPKPYSKNFVLHLDSWYAQSHPDEDFAETFAVWLTPDAQWRERYHDWPAIKKLKYMDELMGVLAGKTPPVTNTDTLDPLPSLQEDAAAALPAQAAPLRHRLPELLRSRPAPAVLGRAGVRAAHDGRAVPDALRKPVRKLVSNWTGIYQYTIDQVFEDMIERCQTVEPASGGVRGSGPARSSPSC